jgi:hypothetical protein
MQNGDNHIGNNVSVSEITFVIQFTYLMSVAQAI